MSVPISSVVSFVNPVAIAGAGSAADSPVREFGSVAEFTRSGRDFGPPAGTRVSVPGRVFTDGKAGVGLLLTDATNIKNNALVDAVIAVPLVGNVSGLMPGQDLLAQGVVTVVKRLDGRSTVISLPHTDAPSR